jgi:hypothetical protein
MVVRSLGGRDCGCELRRREGYVCAAGGYLMKFGGNLAGNVGQGVTERGMTRLMS